MSTTNQRTRVDARAARAWLLVLPVAAYLALALHASAVEAHGMAAPATPVPEFVDTAGDVADSLPAPLAPCCREHTCTSLSVVGPLVTSARDRLLEPRNPHPGIAAATAWPAAVAGAGATHLPEPALPPAARSVYLTTSRLRL